MKTLDESVQELMNNSTEHFDRYSGLYAELAQNQRVLMFMIGIAGSGDALSIELIQCAFLGCASACKWRNPNRLGSAATPIGKSRQRGQTERCYQRRRL